MTLPVIAIDRELPQLPRVSYETAPFWDALAGGRFLIGACASCGELAFPPPGFCVCCASRERTWREASGTGILYALTTIHAGLPGLMQDGPYCRAIVDLEEGVRLVADWLGDKATPFDTPVELVVTKYRNGCLFGARPA